MSDTWKPRQRRPRGAWPALLFLPLLFFFQLRGSTDVRVTGRSATDNVDRIVSLTSGGVEVARYITPYGQSSFTWTTTLPFGLPELTAGFPASPWVEALWSLDVMSSVQGQLADLLTVIPLQRVLTGQVVHFNLERKSTVFLLISDHDICEGSGIDYNIDRVPHHAETWHQIPGSTTFDTIGETIPYIQLNLEAGQHTLTVDGCDGYTQAGIGFALISAFVQVRET